MSGQNNTDNAESEANALNQNDGDSEIPIVSLSELLEENADIFTPIGDLSANLFASPTEIDFGAANVVVPTTSKEVPVSRAESDDDIEFVGTVISDDPLVDVAAKELTAVLAEARELTIEPTSTLFDELKGNSDNEITPPGENVVSIPDIDPPLEAEPLKTVETLVSKDIADQSESPNSEKAKVKTPDEDVVILLDEDDEDTEKMDVDKSQEESVIPALKEKEAIDEEITSREEVNKGKDEDKSEPLERPVTRSEDNNDDPEVNEKSEDTIAASTPLNASTDDVIMMDDEASPTGEKSANCMDETKKGKQIFFQISYFF